MDKVLELIEAEAKSTSRALEMLTAIIGNQREAIYGLTSVLETIPNVDKEKLTKVIKLLEDFDPLASIAE